MKIGLLTSSRADWGILTPLASELEHDSLFDLEIIAFGTHLSSKHGFTIQEIENAGFNVTYKIETAPENDTAKEISLSIGKTIQAFAQLWSETQYDLVICLGDRYEMFAAISSASPFNIPIAHIHAGETTLGAIDNAYRHSISLMSQYLFTTTEQYKCRAIDICQSPDRVYNVGSLSLDNLKKQPLFTPLEFLDQFGIDLSIPTILTTFHPETVSPENNKAYTKELLNSISELNSDYQVVITMPNSDTMGLMVRQMIENYAKENSNIITIESFGMKGYLTCMKYCAFLLGNTSSGFGEASLFPKWVINLGNRQKGRIVTANIINCDVNKNEILKAVSTIEKSAIPEKCYIYGNGDSAQQIKSILKNIVHEL